MRLDVQRRLRRDNLLGGGNLSPTLLTSSGWWRAPYAGPPMVGQASQGPSGTRPLATSGDDPAVGAALNGFAGIDLTSGTQHLLTNLLGSQLVSAAAYSSWYLIHARSVVADPGVNNRWLGPGLYWDSGFTYLQQTLTAAGATIGITASGAYDEATAACGVGAPHLVQAKFNGTDVMIRTDSGLWTSTPCTNGPGATIDDVSNPILFGIAFGGAIDGLIYEAGFVAAELSDAIFDNYIKAEVNRYFGLAL